MNQSIQIPLVLMIAVSAHGVARGQEAAGNWCLGDPVQTGNPGRVWQLDSELVTDQLWGPTVSSTDIRWRIDEILQGSTRHSRHLAANRIWNATVSCGWGYAATQSCMRHSEIDDPVVDLNCYEEGQQPCGSMGQCPSGMVCQAPFCRVPGPAAHAGCNQNGACWVVFCRDALTQFSYGGTTQFNSSATTGMIRHELGHTWGLDHVSKNSTATPPAPCAVTNQDCWTGSNPGSCDGELMCNSLTSSDQTFCTSMVGFQSGDTKGLRVQYPLNSSAPDQRYADREIFKARFSSGGTSISQPAFNTLQGRSSVFKPRIDCADSATAEVNDCVLVRAMTEGTGTRVQIRRMDNWSTSGWGTFADVATVSTDATYPPDIAVNSNGSRAVVAFAGLAGRDRVTVLSVDVNPGSPNFGFITTLNTTLEAELPPRVAYIHGIDEWVIAVANRAGLRLFGLQFSPSMALWEVDAVVADYPIEEHIGSDFDIDCRRSSFTTTPPWATTSGPATTCTIVAPVRLSTTLGGKVARYEFQASSVALYPEPWDMWQYSYEMGWIPLSTPTMINGVDGVAFTNGTEVVVDYSQSLTSASDQTNSRVVRYSNVDLTTTAQTPVDYKADAEFCQTTYDNSLTIPPLTTYGGSSLTYCSSCGTGGALEGIAWGQRTDGHTFCW